MGIAIFILIGIVYLYVTAYRETNGVNVTKYLTSNLDVVYERYAPYSFKAIRDKVKDLGQEYSSRQYALQITIFAVAAFVISYVYFYNIIISAIYVSGAVMVIPYLTYLRCKRVYSEYIFEQIQVYTTNVIMEFQTTQSFVKALEGVLESGVLEEPVKSDVKMMIDLAYDNGTIIQSLDYMDSKYDYHIVRNLHQLFLQVTNEGSKDSSGALENMSQDIDMLVENVYRDRLDRSSFHKKFLQFGIILYLMVITVQFLLGVDTYMLLVKKLPAQLLLHGIIIINSFFLLRGTKYYNENVGAE